MKKPGRGIILRRGNYWFNWQENKIRHWQNLHTSDYAEAVRKVNKLRDIPIVVTGTPLDREIPRFVAYKRDRDEFSRNSEEKATGILNVFAKAVAADSLSSVTPAAIQGWYDSLRKRVTESTAQSYVMVIRSFFKWAVEVERARIDNPAARVRLAKLPKRARVKFASKVERDKLIDGAPTDDLRFALFCGFHAGFRRDEISEARVSWFDVEQGLVHVERTPTFRPKDREDRTIPMTEVFRQFLGGYLRGRGGSEFVLAPSKRERGKSRYRYDMRRPFNDYVKAQGLEWVTFHLMRRTFGSILASSGVSIYKIAKWLGDDVRVTQDHYAHLIPTDSDIERLR